MGHQGFTTSPPVGGLNLVDAIDNMDSRFALELNNLVSDGNVLSLRGGYASLTATGEGNQVQLLTSLALSNGTTELLGTAGAKIWKFASGGATNISGATALTSSICNADSFGQRTYFCNGQDAVQVYDGTSTTDSTFSGVSLANLINVSSYKERIYFIEKNTLKFWYGNTQAVGASALTSYNLQYFMKQGGYLLFAGSITNQTAQTAQDLFFACSSEGELLLYSGSSPADTAWSLVAKYPIGKPLGYRAFIRVNNDVWILTRQGIVSIAALLSSDLETALSGVGRLINPLISRYAALTPLSHMWQGVYHTAKRKVYIMIPTGGSSSLLLVYSVDGKSWTTFTLYSSGDSCSVAVSDESLYYGSSNGTVYTGDTGNSDKGNAISFNGRTAFSFYGARGNYKAFKDIRPLMRTKTGFTMQIAMDTDFQRTAALDTLVTSSGTYTAWGSPWGSPWSSDIAYVFDRFAVRGQGHSAAIRFAGSLQDAPLELYGFEIRFDLGGQI